MTAVKLCGMQSADDIRAAVEAGANYIGFVLAHSRREVSPDDVVCFMDALKDSPHAPQAVLVLVNRHEADILTLCAHTGVTHVQLCGDESPALCASLRQQGITVWKAHGVRGNPEDEILRAYAPCVDAILLDTFKPGAHGGIGKPFSWTEIDRLRAMVGDTPVYVAGGLTVDRVASLVETHHPSGVDVSSGIETDGRKDAEKMHAFVRAVRGVRDVSR